MNKKELVEKLKQNMPEGLSDLETARYVYIELGKTKAFDIRHYYGDKATKNKIYSLARKTERNTDEVARKRTVVCVSLSYLYRDIMREFGINGAVVLDEDDPDKHMYPIVYLKDGRVLIADVQTDMHKIQTQSKTKFFGISKYGPNGERQISDEELKDIDEKIGYIQDDYKDADIEEIAKEVEEMGANDALEHIFSSEKFYKNTNIQGYIEAMKFTYSTLKRIIPHYWEKKVYMIDCYRKLEDNSKEYTLCVFSKGKDTIKPYLYSLKEGRFLKVSVQKLAQLQKEGLEIGRYPGQRGAKMLDKFVKSHLKDESPREEQDINIGEER